MKIEEILKKLEEEIKKIIPENVKITEIELDGPALVVYTKDIDYFAENNRMIKKLAEGIRKRVSIRPDPSVLSAIDKAEEDIRKTVPKNAEIVDINFDSETGEVTIEASAPGIAIGKHGSILNDIKKKTGWYPKVIRSPPLISKTVKDIRFYLRGINEERRDLMRKIGRRIYREFTPKENIVRTSFLGGSREVGRSSILLSTRESKVLVDCGINVSFDNNGSPYLNAPEVGSFDSLDCIVITHAHLDHCGLVPLLYKYNYDGPVYCTLPTRDLMVLLQLDYIKVSQAEARKTPYESKDIRGMIKHCIPLKYGETTDITPDIKLTFHNAGHILGSCITHFNVGDGMHNIVLSGDIKYERTWLFNSANTKFPRLETLILESTYGGREDFQPTRNESTKEVKDIVERTLNRKGKVIVPVFAVGRSQEMMIVLEKLMRDKEIPEVPIYLDGMIWEATAIHTAYPEYLNNKLRTEIFQKGQNPFLNPIFKRVDSFDSRMKLLDEIEPCIVLATSGMLNGGPIMEYLKKWASDEKNTLIFVGYQAEGTLGRRIQKGQKEVQVQENDRIINIHLNMEINTCDGFSGHSDRKQLMRFVSDLYPKPERIIVNHGEDVKCADLASSIYKKYGIETRAPMNLETIRFR